MNESNRTRTAVATMELLGVLVGVTLSSAADILTLEDNTTMRRFSVRDSGAVQIDAVGSQPALAINSTQGAFLPPRLTSAQRNTIPGPAAGSLVFNSSLGALELFDGAEWRTLSMSAATAPVFASGLVTGATVVLSYTAVNGLDPASIPAGGDFAVLRNAVPDQTVTGVVVAATTVTLTITPGVVPGDAVTVSYTPGVARIQDSVTAVPAAPLTNQAVTNTTGPDFEDTFTADGWVDSDPARIGVDTAAQQLDITCVRDSTNDSSSVDLQPALGGNADDTQWVLRFKLVHTFIDQGAVSQKGICIGLSDKDNTAGVLTNQDFIGMRTTFSSNGTEMDYRYTRADDGTIMGSEGEFAHPLAVETVWVEIIRVSATVYTVELFSDSVFTASIEKETGSVAATVVNLRYIVIRNDSDGSYGGSSTGHVDDVQLWNGVSTAP